MIIEHNERGFKVYDRFDDRYGRAVRVQESSIVGRPHVWIFCGDGDKDQPPHLNVELASRLIVALQSFIDDAESPNNWRNDPNYVQEFG